MPLPDIAAIYPDRLTTATPGHWWRTRMSHSAVLGLLGALMSTTALADVAVPCGANVQSYIDANPSGTAFWLPSNCPFQGQYLRPKDKDVLHGGAFDGLGVSDSLTNPDEWPAVGVVLDGLTVMRYGGLAQVWLGDGWTLQNSTIENGAVAGNTQYGGPFGVQFQGSAMVLNNRIVWNPMGGILVNSQVPGVLTARALIQGNEVGWNNYQAAYGDPTVSSGGIVVKNIGNTQSVGIDIEYNWVHNNLTGIWTDSGIDGYIAGNTVHDNWGTGLQVEASSRISVIGNIDNYNTAGAGIGTAQALIETSSDVLFAGNSVATSPYQVNQAAVIVIAVCRAGDEPLDGLRLFKNQVTFTPSQYSDAYPGWTNYYGYINYGCEPTNMSPPASDVNLFYVSDNASHWNWNAGDWRTNPSLPFTVYQMMTGQDLHSLVRPGNGALQGCQMVGCNAMPMILDWTTAQ